jgi:hypothetical protein
MVNAMKNQFFMAAEWHIGDRIQVGFALRVRTFSAAQRGLTAAPPRQ